MARILVAIANHGTSNQHYLNVLLDTYREVPLDCKVFILSDTPKDFGPDIEVKVGAPSPNPWSLPFAHRQVFKEHLDEFDYFIYSEDDTLVSGRNIEAFIEAVRVLNEDEIAGFVRTETAPSGELSYSTLHSHFRWLPGSTRERGGQLWAKYSNEHAACFIATRNQVRRAFESGGFPMEAHEGRHDMLCAAATDIYVTCGMEQIVCVDQLEDFTLRHLPNKYLGNMGCSSEELNWQIEALNSIHEGKLSADELFEPETKLPRGLGAKNFDAKPDKLLEKLIGGGKQRVLIWGGGNGVLESSIKSCGHDVTVVPFNAVMGACCTHRGLNTVNMCDVGEDLNGKFDCVVTVDCLHLCEDCETTMVTLGRCLTPGGKFLTRVPNINRAGIQKLRFQDRRTYGRWDKGQIGATPFTRRRLAALAKKFGFQRIEIDSAIDPKWHSSDRFSLGLLRDYLASSHYLICQAG